MAKWRNFTFRSTAAGDTVTWTGASQIFTTAGAPSTIAGWDGTVSYGSGAGVQVQWNGIVYHSNINPNLNHQPSGATDANWTVDGFCDPNDANNITTLVAGTPPLYPTAQQINDGTHFFGFTNATPGASTNANLTNGGSNTELSGANSWTSSRQACQFDADSGNHDVRIALGGSTGAARQPIFIYDGTFAQMGSDLGGLVQTINIWAAGTTAVLNTLIASKTDLWIWKLTTTNSSTYAASGEPNISGTGGAYNAGTGIYTDANGVQWTKQGRQMLAVVDCATTGGASVSGITGVSVASSSWGAVTANLTISRNCFTLLHVNVLSASLRQFGFRPQTATLADVTLFDEFGQAAATPTIYANQPSGYRALKIHNTNGDGSLAAFSLGGALGSYFTLTIVNVNEIWAVHNGTPIPDSLAGTQSLTVIQTDAASIGSPHTTTFSCTVVSSQSKPTSGSPVYASVSTPTWLSRAAVHAVTDGIWAGYAGQTPVRSTTVTSAANVSTELAALAALPPDGTSWYEIKCQNGTYTGSDATAYALNFGTGGLLIHPDTGHDPEWNFALTNLKIHGVEFKGLRIPCDTSKNGGNSYMFQFSDPGVTGIGGAGVFNRVKFNGCQAGLLYGAGNTTADWSTKRGTLVLTRHGESLEIVNPSFNLMANCSIAQATRIQRYKGGDYRYVTNDTHDYQAWDLPTTTSWNIGGTYFPDNDFYVEVTNATIHSDLDELCFAAPSWAISTAVRLDAYYMNGGNIYRATTAGTTAGSGGGPTGTGTAITDGTVTWTFVIAALYPTARVWTAGMTAVVSDYVLTTMTGANGTTLNQFVYQASAITTGTAGGSNPWNAAGLPTAGTLPSGAGQTTITDGGITWTYIGPAVYLNAGHTDTVQQLAPASAAQNWAINTAFATNAYCWNRNATPQRIYKATTGGTTAASGSGPTSTLSAITDNTITWQYIGDAMTFNAHVVLENITELSQGPISFMNGRQLYWDGGDVTVGRGNRDYVTAINCLQASKSTYGVRINEGELNAEFNTLASAPVLHPEDSVNLAQFASSTASVNTRVRSRHNVVRQASQNLGAGGAYMEDEVIIDWTSAGTSLTGPRGFLVGPFDQDVSSRWQYSSFVADGPNVSASTFSSTFRSMLLTSSGIAGAQPLSTAGAGTASSNGGLRLGLRLGL